MQQTSQLRSGFASSAADLCFRTGRGHVVTSPTAESGDREIESRQNTEGKLKQCYVLLTAFAALALCIHSTGTF
jgi:hypothetical protein